MRNINNGISFIKFWKSFARWILDAAMSLTDWHRQVIHNFILCQLSDLCAFLFPFARGMQTRTSLGNMKVILNNQEQSSLMCANLVMPLTSLCVFVMSSDCTLESLRLFLFPFYWPPSAIRAGTRCWMEYCAPSSWLNWLRGRCSALENKINFVLKQVFASDEGVYWLPLIQRETRKLRWYFFLPGKFRESIQFQLQLLSHRFIWLKNAIALLFLARKM